MLVHYWVRRREDGAVLDMQRNAVCPEHGWERVDPKLAAEIAQGLEGWVVMPIHEIDYHALLGDGWRRFPFKPTTAQRERCKVNHGGRTLEQVAAAEGLRWEEIVAILTDQPWRRLIPMRAFTVARDWPLSVPQ
jgi:hypothetical protein